MLESRSKLSHLGRRVPTERKRFCGEVPDVEKGNACRKVPSMYQDCEEQIPYGMLQQIVAFPTLGPNVSRAHKVELQKYENLNV